MSSFARTSAGWALAAPMKRRYRARCGRRSELAAGQAQRTKPERRELRSRSWRCRRAARPRGGARVIGTGRAADRDTALGLGVDPTVPGSRTSPSGSGTDGSSPSSGQYGRSPKCLLRSLPSDAPPARRFSVSPKTDGRLWAAGSHPCRISDLALMNCVRGRLASEPSPRKSPLSLGAGVDRKIDVGRLKYRSHRPTPTVTRRTDQTCAKKLLIPTVYLR